MKLVVLVSSPDHSKSAGARIRYVRLRESLQQSGIELTLTPIDAFDPLRAPADVVVVSKCYDVRAILAAAALSRRGVMVGIDLFDDYFSDESDIRLSRYRWWLRQILPFSHFALCSTTALRSVVERYGQVPIHVLNDPAPAFVSGELSKKLRRKSAETRASGILRACWFGMGDNPYFPVGLTDVAAYGGFLGTVVRLAGAVELTLLTNRRALDSSGLAKIAELPLRVRVDEWSEEKESELLDRSFVCFLPVGSQPFSVAKSLNRALTALTSGCQVLSVGFPLYTELNDWIYRDPESLVRDLTDGELRLSPASVPTLEAKVSEIASAQQEGTSLAAFLGQVSSSCSDSISDFRSLALLHGRSTTAAAHNAVKHIGGISVASPFCTLQVEFDAVVKLGSRGETALLVAPSALSKLTPEWQRRAAAMRVGRRKLVQLLGDLPIDADGDEFATSLPLELALHDRVIEQSSSMISEAFGIGTTLLSEDPLEAAF
jgi:hypothetical protein